LYERAYLYVSIGWERKKIIKLDNNSLNNS